MKYHYIKAVSGKTVLAFILLFNKNLWKKSNKKYLPGKQPSSKLATGFGIFGPLIVIS